MAGKKAELGGKSRNLPELVFCRAGTAENPDLPHPIVMALGTKLLVKVRYAAGTLKHVTILALARARPQREKGCFGLEWLFFS